MKTDKTSDLFPVGFSMGTEIAPEIEQEILPLLFLHGLRGGRLLDLGCWEGRNALPIAMSDNFSQVVALDVIEYAKEHIENLKKKSMDIPALKAVGIHKGQDLPFHDGYFDVVLMWRVLHLIIPSLDRKKILLEVSRVLKDEGMLALCLRIHNPNESYIVHDDYDNYHVSQRYVDDTVRVYYRSLEYLEQDVFSILDGHRVMLIKRMHFEEYEYRKDRSKDIIPCVALILQKQSPQ